MEIKVSNQSNPNSVAGLIATKIKENDRDLYITAVGAGATNQALKAIAVARGYVAPCGINLMCIPCFSEVIIEDEERTGMKIILKWE